MRKEGRRDGLGEIFLYPGGQFARSMFMSAERYRIGKINHVKLGRSIMSNWEDQSLTISNPEDQELSSVRLTSNWEDQELKKLMPACGIGLDRYRPEVAAVT